MVQIATHSGSFHADESLACYMLLQTKQFKNANIIRTRDPALINASDCVVDVGGIYDPAQHRYDHHQREFQVTMEIGEQKYDVRLSSAGLIYRHFGKEVIAALLGWSQNDRASDVDVIYKKIYDDFVLAFDAIDNGVSQYPSDIRPKYKDSTNISSRVGRLMPWWDQECTDAILDQRFQEAVKMVGQEFKDRVHYLGFSWLKARDIVVKSILNRNEVDRNARIMVLETFAPWKEHLHEQEKLLKIEADDQPWYVVYPDSGGQWRVQAIPIQPDSFESRKPLPEPWRGIRDEVLDKLTGIKDCVFVHASGFIGGNKTKAGAVEMARVACSI